MRLKWSSSLRGSMLSVLLIIVLGASAGAQQAPTTRTDLTEAAALNALFAKLRLKASAAWNISSDPCTGAATDRTDMDSSPNLNPGIKCDCSDQNNTVCHITRLKIYGLDVVGPIPEELRNLTSLTNLDLGRNYLTGPLPSFLGELTAMQYMSVGVNALSGSVPKELGNLSNLIVLWAFDNDFTGKLPDYIGRWSNLVELRFQGNSFQGPIPATLSKLTQLTNLRIGDIVNGSSSMAFISNMTSLNTLILRNCRISGTLASIDFSLFSNLNLLDLSFNNITGYVLQDLLELISLQFLFLGNNSLSGTLPNYIRSSLTLDISYNHFFGSIPSWFDQTHIRWNLVGNDFVIDNSTNRWETLCHRNFNEHHLTAKY